MSLRLYGCRYWNSYFYLVNRYSAVYNIISQHRYSSFKEWHKKEHYEKSVKQNAYPFPVIFYSI